MQLDQEAVESMAAKKEKEFAALNLQLEQFTGGINMNSPKQVTEYLYDTLGFDEVLDHRKNPIRTAKGARSAGSDTLARLRATTDKQRDFLTIFVSVKELSNELSKYLRKFRDCCTEDGGFLQAQFNQCNTQTHRLSSSGLRYRTQFQNFPRAYKPIFKARKEDWLIGEADGAQLEFRVAAHLGRDDTAKRDIEQGTDIHAVTAGIIGVSRQDAKAHTFKPLYGGKSGTPKERKYYKYFANKYDGITRTQQGWIDEVLTSKFLTTEWGMKYYWPYTKMERSGYVTNSTSICNYPVQAFATAEIIPMTLVFFWHRLKRSNLEQLIVNTVHDSIIVELPEDEVMDFHRLSEQCFLTDVYNYLRNIYDVEFTVPLATGVKTAPRWGVSDDETIYQLEI
jgi:DNA polymerase I-like protein with 3'-5' exonuclease and polymerase domains